MDTIRGKFLKQHLLSDEFLDLIEKNKRPMDELMSYYQCAIMEVETKFKVLNQEYSLEYDRNPIEGIKTRVKSYDSILRKIRRKNIPMTLKGIEENIRDIAGVRVICSFPESQGERLPQPASDRAGADLFTEYEETGLCGGAVPHHSHGFLGKPGAQATV